MIDLEVANSTPSPTLDPSVHVILIGHSMGGIVAAETLLLLANEKPIPLSSSVNPSNPSQPTFASNTTSDSTTSTTHPRPPSPSEETVGFLFPHIQAIVAFDTPYLGLAPEMVAHGLEGGHKVVSSTWEQANEVASMFGWGTKSGTTTTAGTANKSIGALPAPSPATNPAADAAAAPRWQSWGKVAMFAGAAGAVAAGGAAALYSQREKFTAGWSWATSHLLFVGDLAKAENLKRRVAAMEKTVHERGLGGCGNFYTNLGRGAREGYGITERISGKERTFCNLPQKVKERNNQLANTNNTAGGKDQTEGSIDSADQSLQGRLRWMKAVNEKAKDETSAHMSMFFPRDNPGFYTLADSAKDLIASWIDKEWYESSDGAATATSAVNSGEEKNDWEGLEKQDLNEDEEDLEMRDEHKENEGELEDSVLIETKSPSGSGHLGTSTFFSNAESDSGSKAQAQAKV